MVFATIRNSEWGDDDEGFIFDNWEALHQATFDPEVEVGYATDFVIHGKTYKERKEAARDLAIDISNHLDCILSWGEIACITSALYEIGKRYGLLKEFRENAVC